MGARWPDAPRGTPSLLAGVRVLDVSRVLAGPYCSMLLADMGASVLKVESPRGDETRRWGPPFYKGTAAYYYSANRNKWGITLDLTTAGGQKAFRELVSEADVLVHNFTQDVADKLGLSFDALVAPNPRLIFLCLSGFGPEEPDRRGYDLVAQAMGGIMAITGDPAGDPAKVGLPVVDLAAGIFANTAVLAALYARTSSGCGAKLEVSLYDSALALLSNQAMSWMLCGVNPERLGAEHPTVAPYGVLHAADRAMVIGAGTDSQFSLLCSLLDLPELVQDPRFRRNSERVAHREELRECLEAGLASRSAAEWSAIFMENGLASGVVRGVSEALSAPEARSVGSIEHPTQGVIPQVRSPIQVDGRYLDPYLAPPTLGEHNELVLQESLVVAEPAT